MDSNSDSGDMFTLKLEPLDSDSERDYSESKKKSKYHWNSENTVKLIDAMERDCKELWDSKHPMIRDRNARQAKLQFLATMFGTTVEEISRKIHNLRTQLNNELRKIKRRHGEEGGPAGSGWEYFEALSFLRTPADPLDTVEGVNLALAEFQADEEMEFGAALRANSAAKANSFSLVALPKPPKRVAASAPPPLPPSANPMMWPDEPGPKLRPGLNADEYQIFGDFVASELRMLRSDEARKKLKRIIQKAILQIGEDEDVNMSNG